jgi:hypothetical protein
MKFKSVISISAAIPAWFAVAYASAPDVFTLTLFPSTDGLALKVGVILHYIIAAMALMVASVIFFVRDVAAINDQRSILLGVAIAFTILCAALVALDISSGIPLQLTPVVATGFVATLCFRTLFKSETRQRLAT